MWYVCLKIKRHFTKFDKVGFMTKLPYTIHNGNSLDVLKRFEENSIDSIVCDPPYELGFMNKKWDSTGIAYNVELWKECLRVLKPGGHLLAFSGSRTYHRMAVAIEDAGFEVRDQIMWVYGSGFPKSHDISKAIDKMAGAEREILGRNPNSRENSDKSNTLYESGTVGKTDYITAPATEEAKEWEGWGTALKPAHEPICLARKPIIGTVAENVLEWGTGGINIGGCRVGTEIITQHLATVVDGKSIGAKAVGIKQKPTGETTQTEGRWPANFIHDGSDDVVDLFPNAGSGNNKGAYNYSGKEYNNKETSMFNGDRPIAPSNYNDSGSVSRFFYCAKASKRDRNEGIENTQNNHPTVKPTDLMQYLCRLVTPPNGVVLDPFMGSGSTGKAAMYEGLNFIGIDLDPEYCKIAEARIEFALNNSTTTKKDTKKEKSPKKKTLQDTSNSSSPLW